MKRSERRLLKSIRKRWKLEAKEVKVSNIIKLFAKIYLAVTIFSATYGIIFGRYVLLVFFLVLPFAAFVFADGMTLKDYAAMIWMDGFDDDRSLR